jgi:hypothetical protein
MCVQHAFSEGPRHVRPVLDPRHWRREREPAIAPWNIDLLSSRKIVWSSSSPHAIQAWLLECRLAEPFEDPSGHRGTPELCKFALGPAPALHRVLREDHSLSAVSCLSDYCAPTLLNYFSVNMHNVKTHAGVCQTLAQLLDQVADADATATDTTHTLDTTLPCCTNRHPIHVKTNTTTSYGQRGRHSDPSYTCSSIGHLIALPRTSPPQT